MNVWLNLETQDLRRLKEGTLMIFFLEDTRISWYSTLIYFKNTRSRTTYSTCLSSGLVGFGNGIRRLDVRSCSSATKVCERFYSLVPRFSIIPWVGRIKDEKSDLSYYQKTKQVNKRKFWSKLPSFGNPFDLNSITIINIKHKRGKFET